MEKDKFLTLKDDDLDEIELYIHNITLRVGELIRKYRTRYYDQKLTIAELAKMSRVSSTVITDLENGRSLPRTEVLLKLASALDLNYGKLFNEFMPTRTSRSCGIKVRVASSIKDFIMNNGLGPIEAEEVMEFIEFKKFRNRKRK